MDKFIALRKCQKPYALAEEVTYSINILVRLLPFVQNILMYKLYFQVSAARHALHKIVGSATLAIWLSPAWNTQLVDHAASS